MNGMNNKNKKWAQGRELEIPIVRIAVDCRIDNVDEMHYLNDIVLYASAFVYIFFALIVCFRREHRHCR